MAWTTPATFVAGTTLTAATLNAQIRDNFNAAFPVGSIHYFMQNGTTTETLINNFALEMNAVSVLRATYVNLNSLLSGLGYPFGTVDGTHLTLPDAKGRSLYHMAASGNADVNALAASDGLALASRSPKHNSTVVDPTHTHGAGSLTNPHKGSDTGILNPGAGASWGVTTPPTGTEAITGSTAAVSTGITVGVGGTRPNDLTPWLVAGVYAVKT